MEFRLNPFSMKQVGDTMNNGKFISTMIRMQFTPRWSEYTPRFEDNAACHSFRCAALSVLVAAIEEHTGTTQLDRLQLLARALWSDLSHTVTGSIKHVTKKDIKIAKHIRTVEQQWSKQIVGHLSKSLQPYAYDYIVNAHDDSYVGQLVKAIGSFDAMLFCYRESCESTHSFFTHKFNELHQIMHATNLPSIKWLIEQFDKREGLYEMMMYILNLDTVKRWNGNYNLVPDNDATHSFRVASLALFNGLLEREKFGQSHLNLYPLVSKAVYHDVPEVICGDVVSTIKNSNPAMKKAFEDYEKETAQTIVDQLPEWFHEPLTSFMVNCKSEDAEGEMVDIADKLDALIKANMEMRNNPHYVETFYQQLVKIQHQYENPSVIFFLAYILHDLTYENFIR